MWDKIIEHALGGSPWAFVVGLCILIYFLVKMYRKDIKTLVTEKDELHKKLEKFQETCELKVEKLNDKILLEKDKRLEEAISSNNEYNGAVRAAADSMGVLTEIVKAMRGAT